MMRKALLAALAATCVAVASAATPALAATNDSESVGSKGVSVYDPTTKRSFVTTNAAEADRLIADYWTPQRRAAAKPIDSVPAKQSTREHQPDSRQAPVIGAYPAAPSVRPTANGSLDVRALAVNFTFAVGTVFFTDPGFGDFVCSASTLNTGKARLVFTAGHCVNHGPGGSWASNWVFDPGYSFGPSSAGSFTAWQLWSKNGWINNGDRHFDYGIAITNNNQFGQKVVNAVGGNGIVYNAGRPFVTSFGYPAAIQGGEAQLACQGQLSRRSITNSDQKLPCVWSGGASGGPMLRDYNTSFPGLGWIVSVISYHIDVPGPEFGPYLDGDAQSLVNTAEGASPA